VLQQITNEIKRISMPAKLEKCVQHVIDQGKDKSSAYAICSKSTGWKKAGKHKWKKGKDIYLSESAITKVEKLTDRAVDVPLGMANKPLDVVEKGFNASKFTQGLKDRFLADPAKQTRETNAKEWGLGMGLGSLVMHAPQIATGDPTQIATAAGLAAGNAVKGSAIGALLTGGKDTLLKSVVIPAAVAHIGGKVLNATGDALGLEGGDYGGIDFDEDARAGLAGGIGGGMWLLRNRKKRNKQYV
jgi:hypothetical protein